MGRSSCAPFLYVYISSCSVVEVLKVVLCVFTLKYTVGGRSSVEFIFRGSIIMYRTTLRSCSAFMYLVVSLCSAVVLKYFLYSCVQGCK